MKYFLFLSGDWGNEFKICKDLKEVKKICKTINQYDVVGIVKGGKDFTDYIDKLEFKKDE